MFAVQAHLLRPRREWRTAARFGAAVLALAVSLPSSVEAASCRGYPQAVRVAIEKHVEALRALEQETAIEEQETGAASAQSKRAYAQAMPRCEQWMDFAPLATEFRAALD
jgi:hypothetical protein